MRWANQYLGVGGYSDHLITDLAHDMADGITLIRLVQALCKSATSTFLARFLSRYTWDRENKHTGSSAPFPHT